MSRVTHKDVHLQAPGTGLQAGALSQIYISRGMNFLGDILRHPDLLEGDVVSDQAYKLRRLDPRFTPTRRGVPRAQWVEMAMMQANDRL